jgi:hypothetical protein
MSKNVGGLWSGPRKDAPRLKNGRRAGMCMKKNIVILILVVLLLFSVKENANLDRQIKELQQDIYLLGESYEELRTAIEDVKSVQGYFLWETDWRNRASQ